MSQTHTPAQASTKPGFQPHKNPVVLITGSSRGIGCQLVKQYVEKGFRVIATVRSKETASELKECTKAKLPEDRYRVIEMDVSNEQSIKNCAAEVQKLGWGLDILVLNAAHMDKNYHNESVLNANPEVMLKTYAVNVIGPALVVRHFLPLLKDSAEPKIVFVSSTAGSHAAQKEDHAQGPSYNCSKAALNMIVVRLSFDLQKEKDYSKVCVFAVHPGWVKTAMGMTDAVPPEAVPTVEPAEAAKCLIQTICNAKKELNGKFFDRNGKLLPW